MKTAARGWALVALLVLPGCGPVSSSPSESAGVDVAGEGLANELITNGTFDTSLSGWTLAGAKVPIRSTAHVHTGTAALRCGATSGVGQQEPNGDSSASQSISLPAKATSLALSFWYFAETDDTAAHDWQEAKVLASSGATLATLFKKTDNGRVWTQVQVDLTPFAGQTVQLVFNVHSNGSTTPTSLWVDDVSLLASTTGGTGSDGGTHDGDGGSGGAKLSVHTTLGIPDSASTSVSNKDHFLAVKAQFVESYHSGWKLPNWVSWELDASELGSIDRSDDFRPDPSLPSSIPQAVDSDYTNSGFDRGHMCPSGDRTLNVSDNQATFLLDNVVPQAANNNRGPWKALEDYLRGLATQGREIFVVAGPVVSAKPTTVGNGVAVPSSTFKVAVVLDKVGDGVSKVTTSTRVIAILVPNADDQVDPSLDWRSFRVTARDIEARTGLDFLSDVPQGIQDVIETRVDTL